MRYWTGGPSKQQDLLSSKTTGGRNKIKTKLNKAETVSQQNPQNPTYSSKYTISQQSLSLWYQKPEIRFLTRTVGQICKKFEKTVRFSRLDLAWAVPLLTMRYSITSTQAGQTFQQTPEDFPNAIKLSFKVYIITLTLTSFCPTPCHAFSVKIVVWDELVNKKVMAQNDSLLETFCHRAHHNQFYFSDMSACITFPSVSYWKPVLDRDKTHPNLNQHFSAVLCTTQAWC